MQTGSRVHFLLEELDVTKPVLIEGLPGIGFVASISALHLIKELKAEKVAEIRSPAFQSLIVTGEEGSFRAPLNELYYARSGEIDLLILYGNTQAITPEGQYELCGKILDVAQRYGCELVACMGGLRRRIPARPPRVFCVSTDQELLNRVVSYGTGVVRGQVVGVAGLLLGLAKLRKMKGFCLLAETPGLYPDAEAAEAALRVLCKILKIEVDLKRLSLAAEKTRELVKSIYPFG